MRLYVNFLRPECQGGGETTSDTLALANLANYGEDLSFLATLSKFLKSLNGSIGMCLDPDINLVISNENREKIKELLIKLQKEKALQEEQGSTDAAHSSSMNPGSNSE